MRKDVTVQQQMALNAKLDRLAQAALRAHERAKHCAAKLVENAARSGQFLLKARDLCDTDAWDDFLLNKFKASERTAYRYMHIAKHWTRLQAIAPPEALTSLRKATQLLESLLLGDDAAGVTKRRRKKRARPTLQLPAPDSPNASAGQPTAEPPVASAEAVAAERTGLERMFRGMQRVLIQLSEELASPTPPNYQVRHAQDAIRRARLHFEQAGQRLFSRSALSAAPDKTTEVASTQQVAPFPTEGG
ncbi:MAG TPA: hypothetical protein VNH11_07105 [Pirellulales bacterium]|nr:hypothetical protein [Pirellulales bacterium]